MTIETGVKPGGSLTRGRGSIRLGFLFQGFAGGAHGGGGAAQLDDRIARGSVYTARPAMAGSRSGLRE